LDKPVLSADLAQVAGDGIHHPKALGLFSQVFGAICQQVPAADTEIASCSNKLFAIASGRIPMSLLRFSPETVTRTQSSLFSLLTSFR
jgi:hypothetical protein